MNTVTNKCLKKPLSVLVTLSSLLVQPVYSNDWSNTFEEKNGFSEFAPPARFKHDNNHKQKGQKFEWRSGSSFKAFNKERFVSSRAARNPWKPVKTYSKKQSFGGQRPWGNIPEKKPGKFTNMRLHDQRFKRWVSQRDSSFNTNALLSTNGIGYGNHLSPFVGNYGYPGYMVNDPLINPASYSGNTLPGGFVPFGSNMPIGYGSYPGLYFPFSGLTNRPGFW